MADDDESQGDPSRVRYDIMVNFFGTLISDVPLPIGYDDVLWLYVGDFVSVGIGDRHGWMQAEIQYPFI